MKRISALLAVLLLLCALPAQASTPYRTFTHGQNGKELVETQTAYDPVRSMIRFDGSAKPTLKNPEDMRLAPDGNLYIADTGNKRILVITPAGEYVKEIACGGEPNGVYVDEQGNVFVASEKGRAVFEYDAGGTLLNTWKKPESSLFGANAPYKPSKLVLDKRGNLYIASQGSTNGIIQISPVDGGEFLGYYGANKSVVSFLTAIKKMIFSDEQLATMAGIVPTSVKNLCIDQKGMVYAVSEANDDTSLRRLNVAGNGTMTIDYWMENTTCVAVNASGSVFTANASGSIAEYTSEGSMLFLFGAFDSGDQRVGTFKDVTALAVTDDYTLYVLDRTLNSVQVLQPTEFSNLVHEAFTLFQNGRYAASKEPWQQVMRMNSLFSYASIGLAEALYREGSYAEALTAYRNGSYRPGYSDAFWELRSDWLHANIGYILIGIVILCAGIFVIGRLRSRKKSEPSPVCSEAGKPSLARQLKWSFVMLKNPFDCCYGIQRERRASWIAAGILLAVFFVLLTVSKYFSGFLFKTVPDGIYNVLEDLVTTVCVFLLFVICSYLVCTVMDGEAKFKSIFVGTAFSLLPMILILPVRVLLTNVLTYNEQFFITLIDVISYGWTALCVILMLMYTNDYSFRKTLWIIVLTLFTALIVAALLFVVYVLISQLVDFISSIYGEVVYRFVKRV